MPALLTRQSSPPSLASAASNQEATSARFATSQRETCSVGSEPANAVSPTASTSHTLT